MKKLERTLDSREVAGMVGKEHKNLMRDINRYVKQINEANREKSNQLNIAPVKFFRENTYKNGKGETRPCYLVTKKGCEFIAHKLTGTKGTIFTARYINRFHEMQDILSGQEAEPGLPWFIRRFRGKYIMLFRDFKSLTGVEICGNYTAWKRTDRLEGGRDYNGWGWYTVINKEEFLKEYGFVYGEEEKCMMYLYPNGIRKALEIYRRESGRKLDQEAYDTILGGLKAIEPPKKKIAPVKQNEVQGVASVPPIQVSIVVGGEQKVITSTGEGVA